MNPVKNHIYNLKHDVSLYYPQWNKQKLILPFLYICFIHFLEHIFQIYQLYTLHLPRPQCLGLVGYILPNLMRSEWLHFGYALFMLFGLYILKSTFGITALILQLLHTIEHTLLVCQKTTSIYILSPTKAISIGEIWFPKIELHLFYTLVVMVFMMLGFKSRFRKSP